LFIAMLSLVITVVLGVVAIIVTIYVTQAPRLQFGFRPAGVIPKAADQRLEVTYDGLPVLAVSQVAIAYVNAGRNRINHGDVEIPVSVQFFAGDDTTPLRILDVSAPYGRRIGESTVEVDVEGLHGTDRRQVSVVIDAPPTDLRADVSGEVRNLARPVRERRKYREWPWAIASLVLGMGSFAAAFVLLATRATGTTKGVSADQIEQVASVLGVERSRLDVSISEPGPAWGWLLFLGALVLATAVGVGWVTLLYWLRKRVTARPFAERTARDF
jgi:hypothetical protein